jgi:penicillin-binding protein 1C
MKRGRKKALWRRRWARAASACLLVSAILLGVGLAGKPPLLEVYSFSTAVYDREGRLMRLTTDDTDHFRVFAPFGAISKNVVDATLLYEDRYFFSHFGVNPVALVNAALDSYLLGGRRRGASTVTMQLARMRFHLDTTSPWGKLVQIFYALKLEVHYSKQEILEAYLNLAPYGGNIVGIRAASLVYFGKEPSALSLAEAMTLSVIPQNPERRKPTKSGVEPGALWEARGRLAEAWREEHPGQRSQEMSLLHPLKMRNAADLPFVAPHLTTELLLDTPGEREIHTTIDPGLQRLLERRIGDYVERNTDVGITNAAAMLVSADAMEVLAEVGSADFFDERIEGQVSAAWAGRSPGSTLKPFVYALAMDQGLIHPGSLLRDAPASFGEYAPENFDGEFRGPLSATEALVRSRNIPAISLAARLRGDGLYGFLKKAGIGGLRPKDQYGLAPVLGGVEMTMEELVGLYAMLKNGGRLKPLKSRLDSAVSDTGGVRLLSKEASFLTLEMLEQNPRPDQEFQPSWVRDRAYAAWKTGTSPGARDAWSVGVAGPFVLAVWVGQFSGGRPIYVGRKAAAPLFFDIIDGLKSRAPLDPLVPDEDLNVIEVPVCAVSGALPNEHCPHEKPSWFIPGKSPITRCGIHREVVIDTRTNRRSCDEGSKFNKTEVYEFWPSDLAALFEKAGLKRRSPPPYDKGCPELPEATQTAVLAVTSPRKNVTYAMRAGETEPKPIAFNATSDADAETLYWFVDTRYIGRTDPRKTLFWTPVPGTFTVTVVDEKGRSDSRALEVSVVE